MEKIDFVMIWVDGNDPKWQKEKAKYNPNKNSDSSLIRYRDWDNLKYWFRGVEKFTPWVNRIHFVTCGHLPEWLDTTNPKLHIVKHSDYMKKEYLPTFSANPIELNLHHIEGLEEKFVYFNDDLFVLKPLQPSTFFRKDLPCDSAVVTPHIPSGGIVSDHLILNDMEIINQNFKMRNTMKEKPFHWINWRYGTKILRTIFFAPWSNFPGLAVQHLPNSFLKSTFEEVWKIVPEILDTTSKNRFRSTEDVNQYLMKYWQLCQNKFMPRGYHLGKSYELSDDNREIIEVIRKQKQKIVCLNDGKQITDFEKIKNEINTALESLLPEKSSFEK